jgi:hypothetical protein
VSCLGALRAISLFASAIAVSATDTRSVVPLSLETCFARAKENNAALKASLSRLEETRGEEIVSRSRLLPQLGAIYRGGIRADAGSGAGSDEVRVADDQALDLELRQRLVELGKRSPEEFARLRRRRKALYESENKTVETLSAIRKTYFVSVLN